MPKIKNNLKKYFNLIKNWLEVIKFIKTLKLQLICCILWVIPWPSVVIFGESNQLKAISNTQKQIYKFFKGDDD